MKVGVGWGWGGQIDPPLPGKATFKKPSLIRVKSSTTQNFQIPTVINCLNNMLENFHYNKT